MTEVELMLALISAVVLIAVIFAIRRSASSGAVATLDEDQSPDPSRAIAVLADEAADAPFSSADIDLTGLSVSGLSADAVYRIEMILRDMVDSGRGIESVLKPIRAIGEEQGWEWFVGGKRPQFNRRCVYLARAFSYSQYSSGQRAQLVDGNFGFWVFRADPDCPAAHQEINGLALPPSHAFWAEGYPPLDAECGCYVVGADSAAGVAGLRGNLELTPPADLRAAPKLAVLDLLVAIREGAAEPGDDED